MNQENSIVVSNLEYVISGISTVKNKSDIAKNYFCDSHMINSAFGTNGIYIQMNRVLSDFSDAQNKLLDKIDGISNQMLDAAEDYDNLDKKLASDAEHINE